MYVLQRRHFHYFPILKSLVSGRYLIQMDTINQNKQSTDSKLKIELHFTSIAMSGTLKRKSPSFSLGFNSIAYDRFNCCSAALFTSLMVG